MRGNGMVRLVAAAAVAGLVVAMVMVATPTVAGARTVELWVEPPSPAPYADPDATVSVLVHLTGVDSPVTIEATFQFGDLTDRLEVVPGSGCRADSGGRYVCEEPVGGDGAVTVGLPVTAKPDRAPTQGSVPVDARALDAAGEEVASGGAQVPIDILSNRVDLSVSANSEFPYLMVGPDSRTVAAYVQFPHLTWPLPLRATYDFGEVASRFQILGPEPRSHEQCQALSATRYRCEVTTGGRGGAVSFGGVRIAPRAGAPPGPVGRVSIVVEQVDGIDPQPANNTYLLTLDLATGSVRTRADMGEATGDIGDTVKLPVTMRNLGPDTIAWMSVFRTELSDGGLDLVGWEGCASSNINPSSECHAPDWMRGGTSHTVHMLIKTRGCLDHHGVTAGVSAASGIPELGSTGVVHVNGCGGPSGVPGSEGGPVSSNRGDPVLAGEPSGPAPAPTTPGAGGTAAPTGTGADPVAVGLIRGSDTGLGGTGLLLLLALLAIARAARWARPASGRA